MSSDDADLYAGDGGTPVASLGIGTGTTVIERLLECREDGLPCAREEARSRGDWVGVPYSLTLIVRETCGLPDEGSGTEADHP